MPNCIQCGADNPANATKCKFCQGDLSREEPEKFMRDAHVDYVDCPKCNVAFMLPQRVEKLVSFMGIKELKQDKNVKFQCPSCRIKLYYDWEIRRFEDLGPRDVPFTIHEDRSLKEDRACNECRFFQTSRRAALPGNIIKFLSVFLIGSLIVALPYFIWPQIPTWYKWAAIIPELIFLLYALSFWEDGYDACKKLKVNFPESKNPNLRCKHWIKK